MKPIVTVAIYKNNTEMIKAALAAGFRHAAGYSGFPCKKCKRKYPALKFLKNKGTVFACNFCGARWGSLIKATATPPVTVPEETPTDEYSELKVLHSNAGYYIGRVDGAGIPYSRESGYYRAFGAAEKQLKNGFVVRDCAENNLAYDSGALPDIRNK